MKPNVSADKEIIFYHLHLWIIHVSFPISTLDSWVYLLCLSTLLIFHRFWTKEWNAIMQSLLTSLRMVSTASSVRPDATTSRGIVSVGAPPFILLFRFHCSRTWEFAPPNPKEFTPTRLTFIGHFSVTTCNPQSNVIKIWQHAGFGLGLCNEIRLPSRVNSNDVSVTGEGCYGNCQHDVVIKFLCFQERYFEMYL